MGGSGARGTCLWEIAVWQRVGAIVRTPNFLFIGPDKAGSSWIFELLRMHPQCYVPNCKDIYFFDKEYDRGWDWYLSWFRDATEEHIAIGEISHDYLSCKLAAKRIADRLPTVRMIVCLRNPVERTFSQYLYLIRSGLTRSSLREAINEFPQLIQNSLYGENLKPYLDRFGREQLLLLSFSDLADNPQGFASSIFKFLGVRIMDATQIGVVRAAARPRSFALARMAKIGAELVRGMGLPGVVGAVKHSWIADALYAPYSSGNRPEIATEDSEYLRDRFIEDVAALDAELGTSYGRAWGLEKK